MSFEVGFYNNRKIALYDIGLLSKCYFGKTNIGVMNWLPIITSKAEGMLIEPGAPEEEIEKENHRSVSLVITAYI